RRSHMRNTICDVLAQVSSGRVIRRRTATERNLCLRQCRKTLVSTEQSPTPRNHTGKHDCYAMPRVTCDLATSEALRAISHVPVSATSIERFQREGAKHTALGKQCQWNRLIWVKNLTSDGCPD